MSHLLRLILPTLVGAALVLIPFRWCAYRKEDPVTYGLSWRFEKRALFECLFITACVLIPLTYVSINWPYEELPRSSSFFRTVDIASAGLAAAKPTVPPLAPQAGSPLMGTEREKMPVGVM